MHAKYPVPRQNICRNTLEIHKSKSTKKQNWVKETHF